MGRGGVAVCSVDLHVPEGSMLESASNQCKCSNLGQVADAELPVMKVTTTFISFPGGINAIEPAALGLLTLCHIFL